VYWAPSFTGHAMMKDEGLAADGSHNFGGAFW
jgi:hypothetical protein